MKGKRITKSALIIIIATLAASIAGYFILNSVIQKRIRNQLTNLSAALQIRFASIHADVFSSSIYFDSLSINFTPYSSRQQNSHWIYFDKASLQQVSFLKFILHKNLAAGKFLLEGASIRLDKFLLDKKDSAQSEILTRIEWPFRKVFIKSIELTKAKFFLRSHESDQLLTSGQIMIGGISLNKQGDRPAFNSLDIDLSNINYPLSRYGLHIRQLVVSSRRGTATIDGLELLPQEKGYNEFKISNIRLTGFDLVELINRQTLTAQKIVLGDGKIAVGGERELMEESLPFALKKIYVNTFECANASIIYRDKKSKCTFNASVFVGQVHVAGSFEPRNFHFSSIAGNLSGVHYSSDNYRVADIKNVEWDSKKEIIQIHNLRITSQLGKYELGRRLKRQANWVRAELPQIDIIKPDFQKLFSRKLLAEKIHISGSSAYIFRDRRLPRAQNIIPLPITYLKTIPFDLRIKTVELGNSAVAYEEFPQAGYGQTGVLKIEKINATISPLINHPVSTDPAYITMSVLGSIMGSGTVYGTVAMPLQKNKPYHIKGAIEKLELTKLNSSSENLGKLRIKSGYLDFLSFNFTMTEQKSTGKIVGAYHHLVLQQLKKHTDEKNVANFASFMLRHLIIPLNKDKSLPERERTGLVNYQRDPTRFVSHYFLQSLLMGVKKSFTLGFLLPK